MHVNWRRILHAWRRLRRDHSGNTVIEFAFVAPIFMFVTMYGIELAYMTTVNMQVSQIAMAVADNASRIGQTDNSSVTPSVNASDIDSVMDGAIQEGRSIKFKENGRVILSSLEQSGTGRQYIHWQRCRGDYVRPSSYGGENTGLTGPLLPGMGRTAPKVTAGVNSAVMYAEAYYNYKPLFGKMFVKNVVFRQEAALLIRDNRNLQTGISGSTTKSLCTV